MSRGSVTTEQDEQAAPVGGTGHVQGTDLVAHLLLTLTAIAWGSSFVGVKLVVDDVPPMLLGLGRAALAGVLLSGYALARGERMRIPRRDLGLLLLLGTLGVGYYYVGMNFGLKLTSVTDAALLGLLLALAGAAFLTVAGGTSGGHSALGDALILSTGLGWTVYTLIGRGTFGRQSSVVSTAYVMLAGTLVLIPAALVEAVVAGPPTLTLRSVAVVVYLGLICSGAGYLMWNTGLARLGAVGSSVYLYLQPVAAIAIALPVLGERPGWSAAAGALVVVAGTLLAARP